MVVIALTHYTINNEEIHHLPLPTTIVCHGLIDGQASLMVMRAHD